VNTLVDASVWSLALRRRPDNLAAEEREIVEVWAGLVREDSVAIIGVIRQEVLSGVRRRADFDQLRERLAGFRDVRLDPGDYVRAAEFLNERRTHGISGTAIDMLICAAAHRHSLSIFTTEGDFANYATWLCTCLQ